MTTEKLGWALRLGGSWVGLTNSINRWHVNLLKKLMAMGFNTNCLHPNVWIKVPKGCYNYIDAHTDDVLVLSTDPTSIFDKLEKIYMIKDFGAPKFYLFCD